MKDRSTMEPIEYVVESIFWCLISMIWYKNILFRCFPNMSYTISKTILWIMLIVSIAVCYGGIFRKKRTGWSVLVSLVFPYGIYTIVSYWKSFQSRIVIVLLFATMLSLGIGVIVMTCKIKRTKSVKRVIAKRFCRCIAATGNIFSIAMVVIMVSLLIQEALGVPLFKSGIGAETGNTAESQTISSNINTVLKLQEEEWIALNTNDKLGVLQCIANIEAHYLGLSNELNVGVANLPEYELACYSDASHTININFEHLENDSAAEVLNSCCHEAYHSYQHRLVDAYNEAPKEMRQLRIYENAVNYIEEFGNYADGYEDFCTYYAQQCEKDARSYAEDAVVNYYSKIDEYLGIGTD